MISSFRPILANANLANTKLNAYPNHRPSSGYTPNSTLLIKQDKYLALNTALGLGLTLGINAVLGSEWKRPIKASAVTIGYALLLANKIWKQTIVSEFVPKKSNRAIQILVSPLASVVTIALAHLTKQSLFELPTAALSTYFIGARVFLDPHSRDFSISALGIRIFNLAGAFLSIVEPLSLVQFINAEKWEKAFQEEEESNLENLSNLIRENLEKYRRSDAEYEAKLQEIQENHKKTIDTIRKKIEEDKIKTRIQIEEQHAQEIRNLQEEHKQRNIIVYSKNSKNKSMLNMLNGNKRADIGKRNRNRYGKNGKNNGKQFLRIFSEMKAWF
jgi:hypothetical protein